MIFPYSQNILIFLMFSHGIPEKNHPSSAPKLGVSMKTFVCLVDLQRIIYAVYLYSYMYIHTFIHLYIYIYTLRIEVDKSSIGKVGPTRLYFSHNRTFVGFSWVILDV